MVRPDRFSELHSALAALGSGALIACLTPARVPTEAGPLVITPATASVLVGDTITFSAASATAADGGAPSSGLAVAWASSDTTVATVTPTGLVTAVAPGRATITASSSGRTGAAVIIVAPRPPPGTVADLVVDSVSDSSVVLRFTDVDDGRGGPAAYDVRYAPPPIAWGSATIVSRGSCATPVFGGTSGATHRCTVFGLAAGADYDFQLVAFRGALNRGAVFGDLSNVATGTTAPSTAPVATVAVAPASVTIVVGGTQQLIATLKDAKGNVLRGRPVAWTSSAPTVATVTSTGLVTAVAVGSTTITATSEGKTGTSSITVVAGPPPVPGLLFQESFDDTAFASRGWYDHPQIPLTAAQHAPGSPTAGVLQFARGATGATFGSAARRQFTPTPTLYVSYWVKYSDNWVGSGTPDHPHEFYILSNQDGQYAPLANDWLTTYIETNFVNGAGAPRVTLQDNLAINRTLGTVPLNLIGVTEQRSVSGCNGVMETSLFSECYGSGTYNDKQFNRRGTVTFEAQPGAGYKGNWNHVEVYLQMNSVVNGLGRADGVIQYWFNGTLIIDRHDVMFRTGTRASLAFAQFVIGPYIGIGSPVDQSMWLDSLTVATERP